MSITVLRPPGRYRASIAGKETIPILWWAGLGMAMMIVMVITVGQWILSPQFRPAPTGSDAMPAWMPAWLDGVQWFFSVAAAIVCWLYLVKPWLKEGHMTWDGRFLLACATIWYLDPLDNYFNFTFSYNAYLRNMSSWANFIPGWQSPRGENFAEPYFFIGAFFVWVFFCISLVGCWLLQRFRTWLPMLSNFSHIVLTFLIYVALDFVFESLLTHTGVIAYVAVYGPLAVWSGTPDQFPLYESTAIAAVGLGVTLMRHYRDDHGQSFAERGASQLALPAPVRRTLSLLAMIAGIQVILVVGFFGQYEWFALKADTFAKYPSYLLLDICGKGTPYACPTREVPIPKRTSLAIAPDDPRLSSAARRN